MTYTSPHLRYNSGYADEGGPLSMAGLPTVPTGGGGGAGGSGGVTPINVPQYNIGTITDALKPTTPTTPTTGGGTTGGGGSTGGTRPRPTTPTTPTTGVSGNKLFQQAVNRTAKTLANNPSSAGPDFLSLFAAGEAAASGKQYQPLTATKNAVSPMDSFMGGFGIKFADGGEVMALQDMNPLQAATMAGRQLPDRNRPAFPDRSFGGGRPRGGGYGTPGTGAGRPGAPDGRNDRDGNAWNNRWSGNNDWMQPGNWPQPGNWQPPAQWGQFKDQLQQGIGQFGQVREQLNRLGGFLSPEIQDQLNQFKTRFGNALGQYLPPNRSTPLPPAP